MARKFASVREAREFWDGPESGDGRLSISVSSEQDKENWDQMMSEYDAELDQKMGRGKWAHFYPFIYVETGDAIRRRL